ncbi:hypothetical protein O3S68_16005 [Kosakonia sp. SOY2]|uniref:hypothetical protein n=1 Tax=Kosakonia sp. SOY2 TaxID=3014557 RepID=UPI0022ABE876|nr:hypothetical protein [Kosakonia sp. SOY2]MCZ3383787.1 hypothetical protein [Kosakonia sp. SOY2]
MPAKVSRSFKKIALFSRQAWCVMLRHVHFYGVLEKKINEKSELVNLIKRGWVSNENYPFSLVCHMITALRGRL